MFSAILSCCGCVMLRDCVAYLLEAQECVGSVLTSLAIALEMKAYRLYYGENLRKNHRF